VLGLSEGEAHVIRNAGGAATEDVIRSPPTPATGRLEEVAA
jgi:hypothetical protein